MKQLENPPQASLPRGPAPAGGGVVVEDCVLPCDIHASVSTALAWQLLPSL